MPTLPDDVLGTGSRKQSNTVHPSAFKCMPCVARCFIQLDVFPPLHAIVFKHLLHVALFESFRLKYSHTLDCLAFGIFTVFVDTS